MASGGALTGRTYARASKALGQSRQTSLTGRTYAPHGDPKFLGELRVGRGGGRKEEGLQ